VFCSPDNGKGYLRCGKVLRLLKKPELALKIYDRGLSKVKIGADNDRTVSCPKAIMTFYTKFLETTIGVQPVSAGPDS
jgi:hypothetical protein